MTLRAGAAGGGEEVGLGGGKVIKECWNFPKHPREARAGEDSARRGTGLGRSWVRLEKGDQTCLAGVERLLGGLVREAGMRPWQDKAFGVSWVRKRRWSGEAKAGPTRVCWRYRKCRITRGEFSNFIAS